jgi:hypothetical protein
MINEENKIEIKLDIKKIKEALNNMKRLKNNIMFDRFLWGGVVNDKKELN